MIYETFAKKCNFAKNTPAKGFKVKEKGLLTPMDIITQNWFIKDNLLLNKNGQLFSTYSGDEISINPKDIQNLGENIFSKRRNSKLHHILKNHNIDAEYVDTLYKQL